MPNRVKVAKVVDLAEGSGKTVEAAGKQIALFQVAGKFYAVDNTCLHRGGPLGEGEVYGTTVVCPWHGWEYDITSGANLEDSTKRLACYPVDVEGDDVVIEV